MLFNFIIGIQSAVLTKKNFTHYFPLELMTYEPTTSSDDIKQLSSAQCLPYFSLLNDNSE